MNKIPQKKLSKLSKFLSRILRHEPEAIGIKLDHAGWTDIDVLIKKCQNAGIPLDLGTLKYIVDTNNKKRFVIDASSGKIRATQGHSVEVHLGYEPQIPPDILYPGTSNKSLNAILKSGIEKQKRHQVHLTTDMTAVMKVGQRHGSPVLIAVAAKQMSDAGFIFYLSENGVWLTDYISPQYIYIIQNDQYE